MARLTDHGRALCRLRQWRCFSCLLRLVLSFWYFVIASWLQLHEGASWWFARSNGARCSCNGVLDQRQTGSRIFRNFAAAFPDGRRLRSVHASLRAEPGISGQATSRLRRDARSLCECGRIRTESSRQRCTKRGRGATPPHRDLALPPEAPSFFVYLTIGYLDHRCWHKGCA